MQGHYSYHHVRQWKRGANENTNRQIRQYFSKKTDFEKVTIEEVQRIKDKLNNRPRKRLGFQTPLHIFNQLKKVAFITCMLPIKIFH
jgi:IS30 family transposase